MNVFGTNTAITLGPSGWACPYLRGFSRITGRRTGGDPHQLGYWCSERSDYVRSIWVSFRVGRVKSLATACGFIHLECLGAFGNGHVSCVRTFFKDEKRGRLSILGIMDVDHPDRLPEQVAFRTADTSLGS